MTKEEFFVQAITNTFEYKNLDLTGFVDLLTEYNYISDDLLVTQDARGFDFYNFDVLKPFKFIDITDKIFIYECGQLFTISERSIDKDRITKTKQND